jgi:hypothetical protein|nr:hypothetical protein [uncultured Sphingomonas sp.]
MSKIRDIVPAAPEEAARGPLAAPQRAAARLQIGERSSAVAEVEVTPIGLLAFGGMVGAILLGVSVVVRAAKR